MTLLTRYDDASERRRKLKCEERKEFKRGVSSSLRGARAKTSKVV